MSAVKCLLAVKLNFPTFKLKYPNCQNFPIVKLLGYQQSNCPLPNFYSAFPSSKTVKLLGQPQNLQLSSLTFLAVKFEAVKLNFPSCQTSNFQLSNSNFQIIEVQKLSNCGFPLSNFDT